MDKTTPRTWHGRRDEQQTAQCERSKRDEGQPSVVSTKGPGYGGGGAGGDDGI